MQRSEIIDMANQLTERKGEKVLTMPTIFRWALQDICKRERFWWRRKAFSFNLVIGTATYDLTAVTTTPANAMSEILLDEITKFTLILQPNPLQTAELTPIFDPEGVLEMIQNTAITSPSTGNTNAPGGRYTLGADGDVKTVRIDPPDQAYKAFIVGWGMPDPASDTTNDTVPLVPDWGHNTVVSAMVWKIFKFAYGSQNNKTVDAKEEYDQGLQDLMQRKQFDPNYRLQLSVQEDAVRST